jgi:DNA-binding CsgD family transcriptional regulator/PAS domain-containing protein
MITPDQDRVSAIIASIYDASTRPELWTSVVSQLSELVAFNSCQMLVADRSKNQMAFLANSWSLDATIAYRDHYHAVNPLQKLGLPYEATGSIVRSSDIWSKEEMVRSEFYNDFLQRHETHYLLDVNIFREGHVVVPLALQRPRSMKDFDKTEIAILRELIPHLQRAIKIHRTLSAFETEQATFFSILDRLPHGVIIVGERGQPTFLNRSAKLILDSRDGLFLNKQGQIEAVDPTEASHLYRAIRTSVDANCAYGLQRGGAILFTRPSGKRPISALITPLDTQASVEKFPKPAAMIIVSDPEQQGETTEEVLRKLYDLTPAEARLTGLLRQGKSVAEACAELQVTSNTARTHLKRVFQKTGARRQSDLVRLVMNGPATIR